MKIEGQMHLKTVMMELLVKVIKSLRLQPEGYNIKYYKKGQKARASWNQ
jgi:hypothetical protein